MAVMIAGFILIVAMFVIRLNGDARPGLTNLPDVIALPDGVKARAFTVGSDWYAVVTDDDRLLIYDRKSGTVRQTIRVQPAR